MTHITLPEGLKLTELERRFLQTLADKGGRATRSEIHAALYPAGETMEKIIDVLVFRVRKKFTALDIGAITTIFGRQRAIEFDAKARASLGLPAIEEGRAL